MEFNALVLPGSVEGFPSQVVSVTWSYAAFVASCLDTVGTKIYSFLIGHPCQTLYYLSKLSLQECGKLVGSYSATEGPHPPEPLMFLRLRGNPRSHMQSREHFKRFVSPSPLHKAMPIGLMWSLQLLWFWDCIIFKWQWSTWKGWAGHFREHKGTKKRGCSELENDRVEEVPDDALESSTRVEGMHLDWIQAWWVQSRCL